MTDEDSVGANPDDFIEFRKCWALGEDYYWIKNSSPVCSDDNNCDSFVFYWSRVEAIQNICDSLDIKDDGINSFLTDLRNEKVNSNSKASNERNFETKLEYLIRGNLMGKDPRYEYIFRAALYCTELYKKDDGTNFLNSLSYLNNFVPSDHINIIKNVIHDWKNVKQNYKDCVHNNGENNENKSDGNGADEHSILELKNPELVEIISRIGGLILGVVDISDLLTKGDRFLWVLICYVLVLIIIVAFVLALITLPESLQIITQLNFTKTTSLETFITSLGIFLGAVLAVYKVLLVGWQKFASYVERGLATRRLKNPISTKKRILNRIKALEI